MSTPNLHCTIYDSHMLMTKKLPIDTIQLLCKLINVNNLLYTYANVMQQIDNSSYGVFIIKYAIDISFGFDPEKSQYVLTQMQTHL
jgi:ASC-1-like (ASCH) protein